MLAVAGSGDDDRRRGGVITMFRPMLKNCNNKGRGAESKTPSVRRRLRLCVCVQTGCSLEGLQLVSLHVAVTN